MAYQPSWQPFRLSKEDVGMPDYAKALSQGFQTAADKYKPATAASDLLNKMLEAKYNQFKSGPEYQGAMLDFLKGQGAHQWGETNKLNQEVRQEDAFNDLVNGGAPSQASQPSMTDQGGQVIHPSTMDNSGRAGVSYEGPGANYGAPTAANTFPGRTGRPIQQPYVQGVTQAISQPNNELDEQIQVAGDPGLSHLDEAWEKNPGARAQLKKHGIEKTQEIKVSPTTGLTSIVTKYPSGKITLRTSGQGPNGDLPLTNAVKTLNQNIIGQAPKAIDALQEIKKHPSPTEVPYLPYRKGARKEHSALVSSAAETYAKAKGWPNTGKSIAEARSILDRGTFESDHDYHQRLDSIQEQLRKDVQGSKEILGQNPQKTPENNSKVVEYVLRNGKYVPK